jgi:hypothetical protein
MPDPREPLGRIFHEAGRLTVNAEREKPFAVAEWPDRTGEQRELDMRGASAVAAAVIEGLRTHEHEWTRCPDCKQDGQPCPCSGTICCEAERLEIAAAADAAYGERERIASYLDSLAANYPEDVFPPGSGSRDGISGTAMRHAYRTAADSVRKGDHYA